MNRQDVLSIIITFVVGFGSGVYFYLVEAAPIVAELDTPSHQAVEESVSIVGEVYGGCRTTCPSFRVAADGSYRYLYTPSAGKDQIIREGELPSGLRRRLSAALVTEALVPQAVVIQPAVCNSYTDGIDVRYEIVFGGTTYVIDSCGTTVDAESELWEVLQSVWEYFEGR